MSKYTTNYNLGIPIRGEEDFPEVIDSTITNIDLALSTLESSISSNSGAGTALTEEISARISTDNNLSSLIDNEISTRISSDNVLSTTINTEISNRVSTDNNITSNLNTEISNRVYYDNVLNNNINTEISNRVSADNNITNNLNNEVSSRISTDNNITNNLNTEISNRESSDNTLNNNINNETSNRISADNNISSLINNEVSSRISTDSLLSTEIVNEISSRISTDSMLSTEIVNEISNRISVDNNIINNINTEISSRISTDSILSTEIVNEISNRISADMTISTLIGNLGSEDVNFKRYNGEDLVLTDDDKTYQFLDPFDVSYWHIFLPNTGKKKRFVFYNTGDWLGGTLIIDSLQSVEQSRFWEVIWSSKNNRYETTFGSIQFCRANDVRLSNARTPLPHTHGNITNYGKIGTTANLPIITGEDGILQAGNFGSEENTFCQGNDERLSDDRNPKPHTHGNITNAGKIGTTTNLPIITTTDGLLTTGSFGTTAGTFCAGDDSRLNGSGLNINVETLSADKTLTANDATYQIYTCSAEKNVILPAGTESKSVFYFRNAGTSRLNIKYNSAILTIINTGHQFYEVVWNGTTWINGNNAGEQINIGYNANAVNSGDISIGKKSYAWEGGTTVGSNATSDRRAVAMGYNARGGVDGVSIGYNAYANFSNIVLIGRDTYASLEGGIAIGRSAKTTATAYGGVSIGYNATSDTGIALGRNASTNSKNTGMALGYYSKCERWNEIRFDTDYSTDNKKGHSILQWHATTTDNAETEIFLGGTSNQRALVLASSAFKYTIDVIAYDSTNNVGMSFEIKGGIKRDGSNATSLIGTSTTSIISQDGTPGWTVTASADDTNEALALKVIGAAGTTIKWNCVARITEIRI